MILEISTHGSAIRRKRERFVVETKLPDGERESTEIPAEKIEAIIVTANAMISTQAVKLCIERQIQLVLAGYGGRPYARMWASTPGKTTEVRRMQYLNSDTKTAVEISREIVLEKLKGQKKLLLDLKNNRKRTGSSEILLKLDGSIDLIDQTRQKVRHLESELLNFKQRLLGFEGLCAAEYFATISACLPKKWQFKKRSQNPGLDGFNASLNYMYGMGYAGVEKAIILSGLDPNAGFYHVDSYGKPTLAFDIIEMCRPTIDRTLVSLFNKRMVRDDWFEDEMDDTENLGIRITKSGRAALLSSYKQENSKEVERTSWNYCKKIIEKLTKKNLEVVLS